MATLRIALALLACSLPMLACASPAATREFRHALKAQPNLDRGAELFRNCASCHGANGMGTVDGNVPRIAGQHFRVLVRQLVDYRHEKRWDIRMEHYAGRHLLTDPQSIADVAAYASELDSEGPRNVGDGSRVQHGAAVYEQACASCHGATGEGNGKEGVPRLAGQHYEYTLRQMYDAVDGRRPNFSREHIRLLAKLDREDLVGVADFLARSEWNPPTPEAPGQAHDAH